MEPRKKSPRSVLLRGAAAPRALVPIRHVAMLGLAAAAASLLACGAAPTAESHSAGCDNPHLVPGAGSPALPGQMPLPLNRVLPPATSTAVPIEPAMDHPPLPGEPPAIMPPPLKTSP